MDFLCHPKDLDPRTRNYLQRVAQQGEDSTHGIFIPDKGVSSGWLASAFGSFVVLGTFIVLVFAKSIFWSPDDIPLWLHGSFVIGCLLAVSGFHTLFVRRNTASDLGRFEFVDPRYWWTVTPHSVKTQRIEGMLSVTGHHHFRSHSYEHTSIQIQTGSHTITRTVENQVIGSRVASYLQAIVALQMNEGGSDSVRLSSEPVRLGATALAMVKDEGSVFLEPSSTVSIPEVGTSTARRPLPLRLLLQVCAVIGSAAFAFLAFSPIAYWSKERYLFSMVEGRHGPSAAWAETYLKNLPDGARADEVKRVLSDALIARVREAGSLDLAPYKEYLRLLPEGPHADEVLQQYEDAFFAGLSSTGTTPILEYLEWFCRHQGKHEVPIPSTRPCTYETEARQLLVLAAAASPDIDKATKWELDKILTADFIKQHLQNAPADKLVPLLGSRWEDKHPAAVENPYQTAFRHYLGLSGGAFDNEASKAIYGLLAHQELHPGEPVYAAFRVRESKYSPLEDGDLPWEVRSKIQEEERRLIQPDHTVFSDEKNAGRETTMLQHLATGFNQLLGSDVLTLTAGTEVQVTSAGAGILIDYELVPEGFRWGSATDEELAGLVFIDFHIEWKVKIMAGAGTDSVAWEFVSRPPQTVTVNFGLLGLNYIRCFDYIIIDAIENYEEQFFAKVGVRVDLSNPELYDRLLAYLDETVLHGDFLTERAALVQLYYADTSTHRHIAERLDCTATELVSLLKAMTQGEDPFLRLDPRTPGWQSVNNVTQAPAGKELDLAAGAVSWLSYDSPTGAFELTAAARPGEGEVDLVVYRALPDSGGPSPSGPDAASEVIPGGPPTSST